MRDKIKFFFLFFIACTFLSLSAEEFDYRAHADKITQRFIAEMKQEFSLDCDGMGGSMPDDLQSIEVSFVAYRKGSIEEAREIEVKAIQRLTALINEDEKLQPYLRTVPFPTRGIEISLSFDQRNGAFYPGLSFISHINGILRYKKNDPKTDRFVLIHQESFEEAVKILESKKTKAT